MNNLLSYWLVDAKIRTSDKDLPVYKNVINIFKIGCFFVSKKEKYFESWSSRPKTFMAAIKIS